MPTNEDPGKKLSVDEAIRNVVHAETARARLNTQMQDALKKAGVQNGKGNPIEATPEPTASPEAAKFEAEEQEEQREIDEAIARMRNEGGVAPDLAAKPPTVPERGEEMERSTRTPDFAKVRREYLGLGERVRGMGVKPEDLPPQAWQHANTMLAREEKLAQEYKDEQDPEKRKKIAKRLSRIRASFRSTAVKNVETGAKELLEKQAFEPSENGGLEIQAPERAAPVVEDAGSKPISPKLTEILGEKVPREVLEMYGKLQGRKKESYLAHLRLEKLRKEGASEEKGAPATASGGEEKRRPRKAGYVALHKELLGLVKESGKNVPESVEKRAAALNKRYLANVGPHHDKQEQAAVEAEMRALVDEQRVRAAHPSSAPTIPGEGAKEIPSADATEGTPKELRRKLREAVERVTAQTDTQIGAPTGSSVEASAEKPKSREEHLAKRSRELDAEAAKMGRVERWFRGLGQKYNKLGWGSKLVVGLGLGLGAAVSLVAVSLPGIIAFTTGIAAQRIAGMSSIFQRFEKTSSSKEKAMMKAMLYTAGMTAGIAYAVHEISQTEWAQRVAEWFKERYPFGATSVPSGGHAGTPGAEAPVPGTASPHGALPMHPESGHSADVSDLRRMEVALEPKVPDIEIPATPGKGYEYMVKQLWDQMHANHIALPQGIDSQSDLGKLLGTPEGDTEGIQKLVHDLATKHGFYNADSTNVLIKPDAHMTIGASGALRITNGAYGDMVNATEAARAHVTPVYPPPAPVEVPVSEQPVSPVSEAPQVSPEGWPRTPVYHSEAPMPTEAPPVESSAMPPAETTSAGPENLPSGAESILADHQAQVLQSLREAPSPGPYTVETNVGPEVPLPGTEHGMEAPSGGPYTIETHVGPEVPLPGAHPLPETMTIPGIEHLKEFINPNNVPIDPSHGHVFADKSGAALAYGNTYDARLDAAQKFARTIPNTSVWVQAEKPVFFEGAWRPWVFEVKYGGFWRGMQIVGADGPADPSFIGAIDPDTFVKQLDK